MYTSCTCTTSGAKPSNTPPNAIARSTASGTATRHRANHGANRNHPNRRRRQASNRPGSHDSRRNSPSARKLRAFTANRTRHAPNQRPKRRRPHRSYQIGGALWADRRVGPDGRVHIAHCNIYVGPKRAGQQLHISITDNHLELFGPNGTTLGTITRPTTNGRRTRINLHSEGTYRG
jgi:hypothetical protein